MSIWRKIKELDKKFSFSFLGVVITILGIIYTTYFLDKSPSIRFEILTNTNIIDLKEDIGKLDVIYNGDNIKIKNKNLRIITIKVMNNGNGDILKGLYDENAPLGFYVTDAEIIEKPILIDAGSEYLKENLKIVSVSVNKIIFSNVIFEKKDFYILKILVLTSKNLVPKVIPTGKIAGVKNIEVVDASSITSEKSFLNKVREGNILIHSVRFVSYILILILFSLIVGLPIFFILSSLDDRGRKRKIDKFKTYTKIGTTNKVGIIFDLYLREGKRPLIEIQTLFSNKEKLKKLMKIIDLRKEDYKKEIEEQYGAAIIKLDFGDKREMLIIDAPLRNELLLKELMEKEIITLKDEEVTIDKEFEKILNEFLNFIKL